MNYKSFLTATAVGLLAAGQASAAVITFENLPVGTILSNQYAGVTFSANAFTGNGGPNGPWATNTDMTIVSSTGGDVGYLGTPLIVSGNILRSFNGWLAEDGDPSFRITFATPLSSISADFAGVSTPADVRLIAFNGLTQIGNVTSTVTTGQYTLSFAAASITSVIITPGSFSDWVGVDNINYQPVPEASTYAMMVLGLGLLAFKRRKVA